MTVLVDTSVLIARDEGDIERFGELAVSAITVGELEAGVRLALNQAEHTSRSRRLAQVLAESPILPADHAAASHYGELRAVTGRAPSNDLWIAATALAHDLTLLTADQGLAKLPFVRTSLLS